LGSLQYVTPRPTRRSSDLCRFEALTGCPVLVNTSFNVRGEPIVCTPKDAYLCFMRTEMDALVLGSCLLEKGRQPPLRDDIDWRRSEEDTSELQSTDSLVCR